MSQTYIPPSFAILLVPPIDGEEFISYCDLWLSGGVNISNNPSDVHAFTRLLFSNTVRRYKYCNDLQALLQVRGDLFGRYHKGNDC